MGVLDYVIHSIKRPRNRDLKESIIFEESMGRSCCMGDLFFIGTPALSTPSGRKTLERCCSSSCNLVQGLIFEYHTRNIAWS